MNKLSSEYWNLHRNSLVFSSALFLACLVSDADEFNVLGLKMGSLGAGAVALILLFASTYCLIALYLEWKEEPRTFYRNSIMVSTDAADEIKRRMSAFEERSSLVKKWLDTVQSLLEKNTNGRLFSYPDPIGKARRSIYDLGLSQWKEEFESRRHLGREDGGHTFPPGMERDFNREIALFWEKTHIPMEEMFSANHNSGYPVVKSAVDELAEITRKIEEFIANDLNKFNTTMNLEIWIENFWSWVRLIGFGFYLPALLYINGVVHCVGRLWWSAAPSWVILALKHVH